MKVEKTPQFLIGPAVRYLIFYLLVKSKSENETKLEDIHLANEISAMNVSLGTGSTVGTSPI